MNGACLSNNTCSCSEGYTGHLCELEGTVIKVILPTQVLHYILSVTIDVYMCNPPCVNGACLRNNTCSCNEGFTGALCEVKGLLYYVTEFGERGQFA